MRTILFCLLLTAASARAEGVETDHYLLDAPKDVVQEYAKVLEAAYPQFQKSFKAKLKRKKTQKLIVRFLENAPTSEESQARGPVSANGHYAYQTQTAYAWRADTQYQSRVQLLVAAATQYHWLACMRNKRPAAIWWEVGLPEYLAQHFWDGTTLTLGVRPFVSMPNDHHSEAVKRAEGLDLATFLDDLTVHKPLDWALCRFLNTGNVGKPFKGYEKWARKMDGGNLPGPLFKRTYGKQQLDQKFLPWLDGQEPPFEQLTGEWHGIAPNTIRAIAPGPAVCRLKPDAKALEATLVTPQKGRWMAGVLLHYTSDKDFSVALLDWGGFLRIQRRQGKGWKTFERGQGPPKPPDGIYKLQAFRKKGQVFLMIGNDGYGPWDLPGADLGFAIDRADVKFRDIKWR